jgi:hypothetical protein
MRGEHRASPLLMVALCVVHMLVFVSSAAGGNKRELWFQTLGSLHVHMPGLRSSDCDASKQHCMLEWDSHPQGSGNISLVLVREQVDPPRTTASSVSAEDARITMHCYVGRHRYTTHNAYRRSQSLRRLAADVYHEHHRVAQHSSFGPTQTHHRLKHLLQLRIEQEQADADAGDTEDPTLADLERESGGVFVLDKDEDDMPALHDMVVSSAVPQDPFVSAFDAQHMFERRHVSRRGIGLSYPDDARRKRSDMMSFHNVPGVPNAQGSTRHDRYSAPGDLVVARYVRTNNWKYCRNVQHGLYFNMSTPQLSDDDDGFHQNRCLVSQWLTDVCWLVDVDQEATQRWRVVGGCAANSGAAYQYSALRDPRVDAHERHNKNEGSQVLPLTVRVCLPYAQRSRGDRRTNDGISPGGAFTTDVGVVIPSFEFMRRLTIQAFERERSDKRLAEADARVTMDWRDATFEGIRPPNHPSWTVVWWSLGGFVVLMTVVVFAVHWL